MSEPTAAEFDKWYETLGASAQCDSFVRRQLDLPHDLDSTGLLSGSGLIEVQQRLDLRAGQVLVELGCGRAGYGLAAIRHTGASLVGVDFSAVALRAAAARADLMGLSGRAKFQLADLSRTGLADQSADAVLCVDALHFADSTLQATRECLRLLRPGGTIVITTWMPTDPAAAERLPERIARMDIERDLQLAGFIDIEVLQRPGWSQTEAAFWTAALAIDPGDNPALISLQDEAQEWLPLTDARRKQLVVAVTPTTNSQVKAT